MLKDLEFDEIGAKATVMYEHLKGIHKVGNPILHDYYTSRMAYFAHHLCTQYSVFGIWIKPLKDVYPKVHVHRRNLVACTF